jgi:hypothetical protein
VSLQPITIPRGVSGARAAEGGEASEAAGGRRASWRTALAEQTKHLLLQQYNSLPRSRVYIKNYIKYLHSAQNTCILFKKEAMLQLETVTQTKVICTKHLQTALYICRLPNIFADCPGRVP